MDGDPASTWHFVAADQECAAKKQPAAAMDILCDHREGVYALERTTCCIACQ